MPVRQVLFIGLLIVQKPMRVTPVVTAHLIFRQVDLIAFMATVAQSKCQRFRLL